MEDRLVWAIISVSLLRKCSIPVIYIEVVIFMEVIGNINIRVAVVIDITGIDTQAISDLAPVDAGLCT